MKNILVTLDLEETQETEKIMAATEAQAEAFSAKCWLLHVAAPNPEFVGYNVGPQYIRDELAEELKGERRQLHRLKQQLVAKNIDCEALMIQGPTEKMIEEEVKKLKIDLLILGNKKAGFFHDLFMGSITDDLIKQIPIAIYLVPLFKA